MKIHWKIHIQNALEVTKPGRVPKISEIYDISDDAIPAVINDEEEINKRINIFPKAALEFDNGEKISYKEYINSLSNPDCTDALLRVYPKINIRNINEFINNMDEISDIRKEFYNIMLQKRYELILTPAYEKAIDILNTKNFVRLMI